MKHLKEYEDENLEDLKKNLEEVGLGNRPEGIVNRWNFFEKTMDYPAYEDVSGFVCEMSINELIEDFKERIKGIPVEDRLAASKAIEKLWIEKITNEF